jgi:Thioesterase superfamily
MQARTGPFWDGVQGRAPIPRAAATLGFEFVDADVEAGTIEVAFDTVGPALLATLAPDQFQSTQELRVRFLRPVRPGRVTGKDRVVRRDGDLELASAAAAA